MGERLKPAVLKTVELERAPGLLILIARYRHQHPFIFRI